MATKEQLDSMDNGVPLRVRREDFARRFVESRNPEGSYRDAFVITKQMTSNWIAREAKRLLSMPDVMQTVQELRDEVAHELKVSARELMQDWHDIATADPNEIVSVNAVCCRFCHGHEHRFQWTSETEWAAAVDVALKSKLPPPIADGGFGFDPTVEPAFDCPSCFGKGHLTVELHDTRKLSAAAKKLYKGAKMKGDGTIEVLMHDQQAARESLAKVMGVFKEGIPVTSTRDTPTLDPKASAEKSSQAYLRLIVNNG